MPLYDYRCKKCGHDHRQMRPMRDCKLPDPCPMCQGMAERRILPPTVWGDIPDYVSPVHGTVVSGRRQRLNDLAKAGCIPYDPGMKQEARKRYERDQKKAEDHLDHAVETTYAELRASNKI